MENQNPVKDIILKAASNLNKTASEIQPFIKKIIDDNWIYTLESLSRTRPSTLLEIGIPSCLVDEIYHILQNTKDDVINPHYNTSQSKKTKSSSHEMEKQHISHDNHHIECKVSYSPPDASHVLDKVAQSMNELKCQCEHDKTDYVKCLQVILRIIDAILKDPHDPQKRRIKSTNPVFCQHISRYQGAQHLLKAVGFHIMDDTVWVIPEISMSCLTDTHHLIASTLESLDIPAPPIPSCRSFNPYRVSIQTSDKNNLLHTAGPVHDLYESQLNDFFKKTHSVEETLNNNIPISENPRVYMSPACQMHPVKPDHTDSMMDSHESDLLSSFDPLILERIKTNTLGQRTFRNRQQVGQQAAQIVNSYTETLLKIEFPDHMILQLTFSPKTTLEHVRCCLEKVRTGESPVPIKWNSNIYLDPSILSKEWYLYETPPRRIIPFGSQTLLSERLVPVAKLYFNSDMIPQHMKKTMTYLKRECIRDFISNLSSIPRPPKT